MRVFDADKVYELVVSWNNTGDKAVLDKILEETRALATYIAARYSDNTEDLVQEALIKVMLSLQHYDINKANLHTYFATVIRNSCITHYCKSKNYDSVESYCLEDIENSSIAKSSDVIPLWDECELQELIARNRQRFPSLSPEVVEQATTSIYYTTRDGIHNKSRGIVGLLVKTTTLNRTAAKIFYKSTLSYMRMKYLSNSSSSKSISKTSEISILPEVKEFMGDELYERFVCVFSGISINVK